jgi:cytochrome c oxidase assembly protein subunit 11
MTDHAPAPRRSPASANQRVAVALAALTATMVGLSFAAVPLYRLFCQVTGYGGTTMRAAAPSAFATDRVISIRFDGSVSSGLNWSFHPVENRIDIKIGENRLAFYKAVNRSGRPVTGTATFNVTPEIAGSYFNKVDCFCFTEQTLAPGQEVDMPVSFFVDPAILTDPGAKGLAEITLSYTFFEVSKPKQAAAPQAPNAAIRPFETRDGSG